MTTQQLTLELGQKIDTAIGLLQAWEPPDGYYLAFSGGKDSVAIYDLAVKAGVKFDAHYCVSPIDPPQIYQFIKEHYPGVIWDYHAKGFWRLVDKKGLPLRQGRWCCQYIKEAGGHGRVVITGNRKAEAKGKGRRAKQNCFELLGDKTFIRPIINFNNDEIWHYLNLNELPRCSLYAEGFERIGCVLCPFHRNYEQELAYFPKIVKLWQIHAERYLEIRRADPKRKPVTFNIPGEYFDWWVSRK